MEEKGPFPKPPCLPWLCSSRFDHTAGTQEKIGCIDQETGAVNSPRTAGGWKTMPYVIGNETFEKVASLSLVANIIVYLRAKFNMEDTMAVNVVNIWCGTCNFAPLAGAFISDAYLGRFRTLAYSSFATLAGMGVLTLTASIPELRPPHCHGGQNCIQPLKWQLGVLYAGLGLIAIGAGGIRPCNLPFGVDQFDSSTEKGRKAIASFFNWYYFTLTVALIISLTGIVYIQNTISWAIGLAIPTAMIAISIIIFFLGVHVYIYVKPQGSIFTSICKVIAAAFHKRHLSFDRDTSRLYDPCTKTSSSKLSLTPQFKSLDKAAIIENPKDLDSDGLPVDGWRLCSIQQVQELKCLLGVIPVWAAGVICSIAMDQQNTFAVLQASIMDRRIGPKFEVPPGSLIMFSQLVLTVWLPVYDRIVVPTMRKFTKKEDGIPVLERIRVGIAFSTMCMLVAGIVEKKRRTVAVTHGAVNGITPMSVAWLLPQFILAGLSDAFAAVAQMEFYYKQFPENMRTIAISLFFCNMATGSYLSAFIISVIHGSKANWLGGNNINKNKLDYYYYLLASIGLANMVYFSVVVCCYVPKSNVHTKLTNVGDDGGKNGSGSGSSSKGSQSDSPMGSSPIDERRAD